MLDVARAQAAAADTYWQFNLFEARFGNGRPLPRTAPSRKVGREEPDLETDLGWASGLSAIKILSNKSHVVNGRRDQLEGKIQERYGLAKDKAKQDVDAWSNSLTNIT